MSARDNHTPSNRMSHEASHEREPTEMSTSLSGSQRPPRLPQPSREANGSVSHSHPTNEPPSHHPQTLSSIECRLVLKTRHHGQLRTVDEIKQRCLPVQVNIVEKRSHVGNHPFYYIHCASEEDARRVMQTLQVEPDVFSVEWAVADHQRCSGPNKHHQRHQQASPTRMSHVEPSSTSRHNQAEVAPFRRRASRSRSRSRSRNQPNSQQLARRRSHSRSGTRGYACDPRDPRDPRESTAHLNMSHLPAERRSQRAPPHATYHPHPATTTTTTSGYATTDASKNLTTLLLRPLAGDLTMREFRTRMQECATVRGLWMVDDGQMVMGHVAFEDVGGALAAEKRWNGTIGILSSRAEALEAVCVPNV